MARPDDPSADQKDDTAESHEWLEALEDLVRVAGRGPAGHLLQRLIERGGELGVRLPSALSTPYVNTIARSQQPAYPGDVELERRILGLIRWNAMAMVVRANMHDDGLGGHISSYASAATLYEVGFNHFFRGRGESGFDGDAIYFQAHSSPGIYARAFLEGRLDELDLEGFRRDLGARGLPAYPHPYRMPDFWETSTASLGLGAIMAIYQARFDRYLHQRGIVDARGRHVWAFLGDGETDEPETLGAITLAAREQLDNLIFVVNCNLQRADGPVRGSGKIIQELETTFRGAGWNVVKVIWGGGWDSLIEADDSGLLVRTMNETLDGEYQKYVVETGAFMRQQFFGRHPETLALVEHLSDDELLDLTRGGHDAEKVYAAYDAAVKHTGQPTVVLAKTIKGYGLEAAEARNVTHQQKKLNAEELRAFRDRFAIPIPDDRLYDAPFYRPPEDSQEIRYLRERRRELGGFVPRRKVYTGPTRMPTDEPFAELHGGFDREVSTTMTFVRLLARMAREGDFGHRIVPIVADAVRTFGMESMIRQVGIYSSVGQLYEPVDAEMLLYYKETKSGQILQEGVNSAGALASWLAAATSHVSHGAVTVPFYIFYSIFGFQRIGDLIWAAADMRARGFLAGAVAGRTTLNGEGFQHQDGHSHLVAAAMPSCVAYDPAYGYEVAVIVRDGLRRMYEEGEDVFYYMTLYNESYEMPPKPPGVDEGILKGIYRLPLDGAELPDDAPRVQLFASGPIVRQAVAAATLLADAFGIGADVWSVTSFSELRRDGLQVERWNRLHPTSEPRRSFVSRQLADRPGPVVAASDYVRAVADQIRGFLDRRFVALGTDGYGRSDTRQKLRRYFEVDSHHIAYAACTALAAEGVFTPEDLAEVHRRLHLDSDPPDPAAT